MNYIEITRDLLANWLLMAYFLLSGPGILYILGGFGASFAFFVILPKDENR